MNKYVVPIKDSDYYRIAFNAIDEGFIVIEKVTTGQNNRIDFRYILTNPAFERITGLTDIIGKTVMEVLPGFNDSTLQIYDNVNKTGQPVRFETYEAALERWFSAYAFSLDDPKFDRVAVILNDISDLKKSEKMLVKSSEHETLILKLSDVLYPLSDPLEIHRAVTRAALDYFKADRCYYCEIVDDKAIIRQDASCGDLPSVAGVYPLSSLPIHKSLIEAGLPFSIPDVCTTEMVDEELRQLCIQLKVISYLDVPVIKNGIPVGILCIVQSVPRYWTSQEAELAVEISERTWAAVERTRAERALHESEAALRESEKLAVNRSRELEEAYRQNRNIVESIADCFYTLDKDLRFCYVNEAAEKIWGIPREELIGRKIEEVFPDLIDLSLSYFRKALEEQSPQQYEVFSRVIQRWGDMNVYPTQDGISVYFRDTTERKLAEELLQKSNDVLKKSIEMKDEFLSLISHEFRTPLTVIISAIQMLKTVSWNELSDKAKGYFNTIRQNSNRQLKLVNNILDITKINAGSFVEHKTNSDIVQLTKLIIESIGPFADRKKIRVSFLFNPAEIIIGIDEEKYERILLNLLSNAIKYTPKGESITVKLSRKIIKNKSMACIQVCDSGIGIPEDKQEHIFERFGQVDSVLSRQAEGTGIGLHLTRMFVEMLGGEIRIDSKLGTGSTFTVLIPAIKVQETHSEGLTTERADNRTIQLTEIEFSDIYLDK